MLPGVRLRGGCWRSSRARMEFSGITTRRRWRTGSHPGGADPDSADVKVIGVGNVHYSDLLRVPLSTIDQSSHSIGEQAAEILLKAIGSERRRPARNVIIEPRLVAREPTAA